MKSIHKKLVSGTILLVILTSSCGIYSFSGSLPPHLKTVAVPLFENKTAEFGVTEEITDIVINEFNKDGSLKIGDEAESDVLIEGEVIRIDDKAGAFNQSEEVQDIKLYITVKVKCTDQVNRQIMWDERITQYGSYDPADNIEGRALAITEALENISQEVLNKTVSGW